MCTSKTQQYQVFIKPHNIYFSTFIVLSLVGLDWLWLDDHDVGEILKAATKFAKKIGSTIFFSLLFLVEILTSFLSLVNFPELVGIVYASIQLQSTVRPSTLCFCWPTCHCWRTSQVLSSFWTKDSAKLVNSSKYYWQNKIRTCCYAWSVCGYPLPWQPLGTTRRRRSSWRRRKLFETWFLQYSIATLWTTLWMSFVYCCHQLSSLATSKILKSILSLNAMSTTWCVHTLFWTGSCWLCAWSTRSSQYLQHPKCRTLCRRSSLEICYVARGKLQKRMVGFSAPICIVNFVAASIILNYLQFSFVNTLFRMCGNGVVISFIYNYL